MRDYTTFYPLSSEALEPSGTSAQFAAFAAGIRNILIVSKQDVWIAIGDNPTAEVLATTDTGDSFYVPADTPMIFHVGEGQRAAVIEDAATTGVCVVTQLTR